MKVRAGRIQGQRIDDQRPRNDVLSFQSPNCRRIARLGNQQRLLMPAAGTIFWVMITRRRLGVLRDFRRLRVAVLNITVMVMMAVLGVGRKLVFVTATAAGFAAHTREQ